MLHQKIHEVGISDSVLSWNDDIVEEGILGDGRQVLKGVGPWHPFPHSLLDEVVIVNLPFVRERNGKGFLGSIT